MLAMCRMLWWRFPAAVTHCFERGIAEAQGGALHTTPLKLSAWGHHDYSLYITVYFSSSTTLNCNKQPAWFWSNKSQYTCAPTIYSCTMITGIHVVTNPSNINIDVPYQTTLLPFFFLQWSPWQLGDNNERHSRATLQACPWLIISHHLTSLHVTKEEK